MKSQITEITAENQRLKSELESMKKPVKQEIHETPQLQTSSSKDKRKKCTIM